MPEFPWQVQHNFFSPNKVSFGIGVSRNIGAECRLLCGTRILVVTDPGIVRRAFWNRSGTHLRALALPKSYSTGSNPSRLRGWWMKVRLLEERKDAIWWWESVGEAPWTPPRGSPS